MDFFRGKQATSGREGFLVYIYSDLYAVKWRNWKYHAIWLDDMAKTPAQLPVPYLFNLLWDPKEETNVATENSWVQVPIARMIREFQQSLSTYPPIPPGTPDPYVPAAPKKAIP
jgi:hypothetical protein